MLDAYDDGLLPAGEACPDTDMLDLAAAAISLAPAFQPIVSLPDAAVVGFEALARWPALGNPHPLAVFERARATGCVDELDQMCIDCAIEYALAGGLARDTLLMLNCEPNSVYVDCATNVTLAHASEHLQITFELTERSLLEHPRALLRKVAALRADGFAIALDDVGVHPDSLALLDVICPDAVKLDMQFVQCQPDDEQTRTLAAVLAHRERTGATLIAEGIESEEHLEQALALGADMGQGYRFGRPQSLDAQSATSWSPAPRQRARLAEAGSPFDVVADKTSIRTARRATLIAFTHHIERQALHSVDPPILLCALQNAENFVGSVADFYHEVAATLPLVAVFGHDVPAELGCGVRGIDVSSADPLCAEWTVVVLGPHHAAALVAREHAGAAASDLNRRFDFTITYDRALVTLVARNLLDRIA